MSATIAGTDALFAAALDLDVGKMRAALEAGGHAKASRAGCTPVQRVVGAQPSGFVSAAAMESRRLAALQLLAGYGGLDGRVATSVLRQACGRDGSPAVIHMLLDAGADVRDACPYTGITALHRAPSADVVRLVTAAGGDVNARDLHGRTPLHYCACGDPCPSHSRVLAAAALLEAGADVNAVDACGATDLWLAAGTSTRDGSTAVLPLLLVAGADPTITDDAGMTPFACAVELLARCLQRRTARDAPLLANKRRDVRLLARVKAWWRRRHALLAIRGRRGGAPAASSTTATAGSGATPSGVASA